MRSDSGMRTDPVAGRKTGGFRSASAKDSASGPVASRSSSPRMPRTVSSSSSGYWGLPEQILAPQHLEQVELDVPQVALVVAHPLLRRVAVHPYCGLCYPRRTTFATREKTGERGRARFTATGHKWLPVSLLAACPIFQEFSQIVDHRRLRFRMCDVRDSSTGIATVGRGRTVGHAVPAGGGTGSDAAARSLSREQVRREPNPMSSPWTAGHR